MSPSVRADAFDGIISARSEDTILSLRVAEQRQQLIYAFYRYELYPAVDGAFFDAAGGNYGAGEAEPFDLAHAVFKRCDGAALARQSHLADRHKVVGNYFVGYR